ncbi:MAG: RluA family pseudouridine synthase [Parachlamydiales bacterium]|nr:RluA family pseudouridine synthase [Parachlamydiales bacterium]
MKEFFTYKVSKNDKGKKLLVFLKEKLKNLSNKQIKRALDKGLCLVDKKIERFGSVSLKLDSTVQFYYNYESYIEEKREDKIKIIFEDEYLLAIDKPTNFVSSDEVIHNFLPKKFTLIHRLDKDTSGVLLIAKSSSIKEKMIPLFSEKKIDKYYLAIVDKEVKFEERSLETYIEKDRSIDGQTLYKCSSRGKYSLTHFKTLKTKDDFSLILAQPSTGRTHQIRVHLKKMGHPILGDYLYNNKFKYNHFVSRLMLHSFMMEFVSPFTNEDILIKTDIPEEFFKFFQNIEIF